MESKEKFREKLESIITSGNEEDAKRFIMENFSALPEKMQNDLVLTFFEEGLEKATAAQMAQIGAKARSLVEICNVLKGTIRAVDK